MKNLRIVQETLRKLRGKGTVVALVTVGTMLASGITASAEGSKVTSQDVSNAITVDNEISQEKIAKPIKVSNLSEKVASFKEELQKAGVIANDQLIENAVRVINSDFIQHDGLCEITAQKHEHQLSLLTSHGSVNNVTLGALYMGYIDKVDEGFYIPAEICPKQNRKFINAFTKLSESYRKSLNKLGMVGMIELTDEECDEISKESYDIYIEYIKEHPSKYEVKYQQKLGELFKFLAKEELNDEEKELYAKLDELCMQYKSGCDKDTCNKTKNKLIKLYKNYKFDGKIQDEKKLNGIIDELTELYMKYMSEYDRKYQEIYNQKIAEVFEEKQPEQAKAIAKREKEAKKIYKEFYNDVMELVKSEEYEKLTPSEKVVVFINISGALTSGMTEKQKDQYMDFQKGIELSIDEAREQLVVANRKNINQQDALDTIVANNKEQVKQERNDLEAIGNAYEIMYYSGIQLVR